jgi:hypothetical protein
MGQEEGVRGRETYTKKHSECEANRVLIVNARAN